MFTKIVLTGHHLGDVDVAGTGRDSSDAVVAVLQLRLCEDARHDVTRDVVTTTHSTPVHTGIGANQTVAAHSLSSEITHKSIRISYRFIVT